MSALQYKLRIKIGLPRDVFYSMIWPYIPEAPPAPEITKRSVICENPPIIEIHGICRVWSCVGANIYLSERTIENAFIHICCMCEHRPTYTNHDRLYSNNAYTICFDCNELIKNIPDFFK